MDQNPILSIATSAHYPDKQDVDRSWIAVDDFLAQRGLLNLVFEEDLFLALDTALRELGWRENMVLLIKNSAKRLCFNPLLLPGMERYFAHYPEFPKFFYAHLRRAV
ncbi:MAG: hypothetical protein J5846_02155 [Desulfovibrio sp.]|nr:hypothetical protein [Desulfovibrio sp.]